MITEIGNRQDVQISLSVDMNESLTSSREPKSLSDVVL